MQCLYKAVKKKGLMAEKKDERFITIHPRTYYYCSETFWSNTRLRFYISYILFASRIFLFSKLKSTLKGNWVNSFWVNSCN